MPLKRSWSKEREIKRKARERMTEAKVEEERDKLKVRMKRSEKMFKRKLRVTKIGMKRLS